MARNKAKQQPGSLLSRQRKALMDQALDKAERTAKNRGGDPWKGKTQENSRTLAPRQNATFRTGGTPIQLPNSGKQGRNLVKEGADQMRQNTQGPSRRGAQPPAQPQGTYKAPNIPKPKDGTAAKPAVKGARLGGTVAAAIGEVAGAALGPVARAAGTKLGQALRPVGRAIDDRLPGINSKDEAARRQRSTPLPQMTADERRRATPLRQATPSDAAPRRSTPAPTRAQSTQQRATQAPRSSNSGGTTSTSSRNTPAPTMPSVVKERRVSASTANRESGNYGTSRTNNPLMSDLKAGMERREQARADKAISDGKATRAEYNRTSPPEVAAKAKENFDKLSDKEKKRVKDRYS